MDLRRQAYCLLRIGPCDRARAVHAITGPEVPDRGADRLHDPGRVHAGRVRQRRLDRIGAGPDVGVHGIDARGLDRDQDLLVLGSGSSYVLDLQDLRLAELVHPYRLHGKLLLAFECRWTRRDDYTTNAGGQQETVGGR